MTHPRDQFQLFAQPAQPRPDPRPLLPFPPSTTRPLSTGKPRFPPSPKGPGPRRQNERLTPQFQALQQALTAATTTLSDSTAAPDPEMMVVFEVASTIDAFVRAARKINGLEFITDFVDDAIEPDDDFHYIDAQGERTDREILRTLYLMMTNERALEEIISLFKLWQTDPQAGFQRGYAPLKEVFAHLRDVRRWGPRDRITETGLHDQLLEDINLKGRSGDVKVEIELVWNSDKTKRDTTQRSIEHILAESRADLIDNCEIPAVKYHALLAKIPADELIPLLRDQPEEIELLCADGVLFVSPGYAMSFQAGTVGEQRDTAIDENKPSGLPKAALLDGLPLANHDYLKDRLTVDDPDDITPEYSLSRRYHGTAMASLIIHGDLNDPGPSLSAPIYVRPVMVPHEWQPEEILPSDRLLADVLHEAIQRIAGGREPTAPSVRIINISLGDPARMFIRHISSTARLLDYLAHEHNLVIIVSAGNHGNIRLRAQTVQESEPETIDHYVRRDLHANRRNRRILSPSEAVNIVTVGALHEDSSDMSQLPDAVMDPLRVGSVAAYSPIGAGYRRSPKPEIHVPGGRTLYHRPPPDISRTSHESSDASEVELTRAKTEVTGPGHLVAAPTPGSGSAGTLYTSGTSNAAALTTRSAHQVLEVLESLTGSESADSPPYPDEQYHPVLVKTLLVHAAMWPEQADRWAEQLHLSGRKRKSGLTEYLGFGVLDSDRVATAASNRVTVIGAASIQDKETSEFRFPLPSSLAATRDWRRLVLTVAWLTPIVSMTQRYRVAELTCTPNRKALGLQPAPASAYHHVNGKGTVHHEILESNRIVPYMPGDDLTVEVTCRVRVGRLEQPVRFGLAATLEVGADVRADIHGEVSELLRPKARITVERG